MTNLILAVLCVLSPPARAEVPAEPGIRDCQVLEYLGASYDPETKKYRQQKWTPYTFGPSQVVEHTFKLLAGITLKIGANEGGSVNGQASQGFPLELEDSLTGVKLSNWIGVEKIGTGLPRMHDWFSYERANKDAISVTCQTPI